jgi:hypothetical protein
MGGGEHKGHKGLHNLNSSPNIITAIKSRKMKWGERSDYYLLKEGKPVLV